MHYFYYPQSIVTAGNLGWEIIYDPVLLYGALLEAAAVMKAEADMLTAYKAKYDEALNELRRLCDALERGDSYRDGQLKLNVARKGGAIREAKGNALYLKNC
jgi:hypothetical protein